jgi:hypothetical protein
MFVLVPDSSQQGRDGKNTLAAQSERQSFQFMPCMIPLLLLLVLHGLFHSTMYQQRCFLNMIHTNTAEWI